MNKLIYYDGVKSVPFSGDMPIWSSAGDQNNAKQQYKLLSTIYRATNMIANDVSRMPFVVRRDGKVVETSQDYANLLGFLPNPRRLFYQLSASLDLNGCGYAMAVRNRAGYITNLRYAAARTIAPVYDRDRGDLVSFERRINDQPPQLLKPGKDIVHFWIPDDDVEIGPPTSYPLRAALTSADVLINLDQFIAAYFKRGMIRPIIVSVDGDPPEQERTRMEDWFNSLWSGIKNAFRLKVFNAGTVKTQQIGDGLDQLHDMELTTERKKDVALAFGVPYAMLFSEAASFSTLQGDTKFYYTNTIEPRCELIASEINSQAFGKGSIYDGWSLEFTPESLDVYQRDERERSTALVNYVSAGIPVLLACDMLGIEMTDEQRAVLEVLTPDDLEPAPVGQPPKPADESSNPDIAEEAARWRRKALKAIRNGKSALVDFDTDIIPVALQDTINDMLRHAKTDRDVIAVFERASSYDDAASLTDAVLRLAEAMERG